VDPLSGEQFELSAGDYRATIASVGASLRELTWQGRHLVVPFDAHEIRPDYRGAVLAPWPNRVVDGKYQFDGLEHQLALTEPERGHALHGLVVWQDFTPINEESSAVTLGATVPAQTGYPFAASVLAVTPDRLTLIRPLNPARSSSANSRAARSYGRDELRIPMVRRSALRPGCALRGSNCGPRAVGGCPGAGSRWATARHGDTGRVRGAGTRRAAVERQ
jgi:Aldose 1-epimerase